MWRDDAPARAEFLHSWQSLASDRRQVRLCKLTSSESASLGATTYLRTRAAPLGAPALPLVHPGAFARRNLRSIPKGAPAFVLRIFTIGVHFSAANMTGDWIKFPDTEGCAALLAYKVRV